MLSLRSFLLSLTVAAIKAAICYRGICITWYSIEAYQANWANISRLLLAKRRNASYGMIMLSKSKSEINDFNCCLVFYFEQGMIWAARVSAFERPLTHTVFGKSEINTSRPYSSPSISMDSQ